MTGLLPVGDAAPMQCASAGRIRVQLQWCDASAMPLQRRVLFSNGRLQSNSCLLIGHAASSATTLVMTLCPDMIGSAVVVELTGSFDLVICGVKCLRLGPVVKSAMDQLLNGNLEVSILY